MDTSKATVAYFCPECGSAAVNHGELVGSRASCVVCPWEGSREQLLSHLFTQEQGSSTEMLRLLLEDMRVVYGECALPFARLLSKWGFFTGSNRDLARYMMAMALASFDALVKTRTALEKEKVDARRTEG